MADINELLLGQIALERGLITREQLAQIARLQELAGGAPADSSSHRIGSLFVQQGILSAEQVETLLAEQRQRLESPNVLTRIRRADNLFGQMLLKAGKITFPNLYDRTGDTIKAYRAQAYDFSYFVVDSKGIVRFAAYDHPPEIEKEFVRAVN